MHRMRDFLKDEGNCYRGSLKEAKQALEDRRVTTEVWRRDEQVHYLRTELGVHALHSDSSP